jgi:hypothetical protein
MVQMMNDEINTTMSHLSLAEATRALPEWNGKTI